MGTTDLSIDLSKANEFGQTSAFICTLPGVDLSDSRETVMHGVD
jgi:hypothetical protein